MSTILIFWAISLTLLALLFVGAALIDTFNNVSRQIKEFLNEHK
jgi:hypothetical protein